MRRRYGLIAISALAAIGAEACEGIARPPVPATILAPVVPQAKEPDDLVGVVIQNLGREATGDAILGFGQIVRRGALKPGDAVTAHAGKRLVPVQLDALALWPDGSVKLAHLALPLDICAGRDLPVLLARHRDGDPDLPGAALALPALRLDATLTFASGPYDGVKTVDLGTLLPGAADFWLRGPYLTEARVDAPVAGGPLHLTADVRVESGGAISAEIGFNADRVEIVPGRGNGNNAPPLPAMRYDARVTLNGVETAIPAITQFQYQDWRRTVATAPWPDINVLHDLAYLERTGAVLPWDGAAGVPAAALGALDAVASAAGFGAPLASNGVALYMPTTGDRGDIGFAPEPAALWLLTGDRRAARVALAQADAGGAVPWNTILADGQSPAAAGIADLWIDVRADGHALDHLPAVDCGAASATCPGWTPDTAHPPDLAYVPYLMTGSRWYLDRLNAEAAYAMLADWPGYRCQPFFEPDGACVFIVNGSDQVRAQAWSIREIEEAGFIGRTGSPEQRAFAEAARLNWAKLASRQADMAALSGEATAGYLNYQDKLFASGAYPSKSAVDATSYGGMAPWQQDYFIGVAALAALMGEADARRYLAFVADRWLSQRFVDRDANPHDGCAYALPVYNLTGSVPLKGWGAVKQAALAANLSNKAGWATSDGDYCALAKAALGAALTVLPDNPSLRAALAWLKNSGAPRLDAYSKFNLRPIEPFATGTTPDQETTR